jgi:hypothetical protein
VVPDPLEVAKLPCPTCPYRKDTPPGIWSACEYSKLPLYDEGQFPPVTNLFLCHQSKAIGTETVCRGWLTVASESVAVRLAVIRGHVTPEQVYEPVAVELYNTGREACDAGTAGIDEPSAEAVRKIHGLVARGVGRYEE